MNQNQFNQILQNTANEPKNISIEMRNGIIIGTVLMGLLIVSLLTLYIWHITKARKKETMGFKFESQISNELTYYTKNKKINFKYIPGGLYEYAMGSQKFEIDGILYNNKIFIIIETKYLIGELKGSVANKNLSLVYKKHNRKVTNPISQNHTHLNHFHAMCGFNLPMLSMIIFPEDLKFSVEGVDNHTIIASEKNYQQILQEVENDLDEFGEMDKEKVNAVLDAIKTNKVTSRKDIKKWEKGFKQNGE
ncbi:NERD domain-containing protein [Mycoplasma sp. CSL7475-4]|uniref:nuclease-related domain-containing protein n=1 Tax=Mycoplasma sp. CSL7475-4 TaxID=2973942 RepID=UPI00216AB881|nr:NERD domain-containing protein [Mycoplasma sp. CSL7475-4]MCS4536855.1 NERD domain-containing protein [Mycoplasma sp. CSL7475-4]